MEIFRENFFLQNSQNSNCAGVIFNKVIGLYSATLLKEMTPTQVLNFLPKETSAKREKWTELVRKTTKHVKQKLNHC